MNPTIKKFIRQYWILLLIVLLKMILQYIVVNPYYELHRDEFLHLDQANHLALGFISVPPFTSLVSKVIFLLGGSLFWIRFFPAIFGALTIVFAWLIVEAIDGKLPAKILVSGAILFSVIARINILFQPNSFDILAWTVIFYLLVKFIQSASPKWLWCLAFTIAAGVYNKYNIGFLLFGLTAGLLLTQHLNIFLNKSAWKACLVLIILLLPNGIWQLVHQFPVIEHMKVLKASQLDNNSALGFLIDQVLFFSGSLLVVFGGLIGLIFYKPFRPYRFVGISFIVILVIFALLKAKGYYALGIYPVILAFGSVYIESLFKREWKTIVILLLFSINLVVFILTVNTIYPVYLPAQIQQHASAFEKLGMLRWEDGQNHAIPQDFADMTGWKEMAAKSLEAYKKIPVDQLKNTLIFCDNYGQTGALNYYNRGEMQEAYSFNTDYIYWIPSLNRIQNIVLVGKMPSKEILNMFASYKVTGEIENKFSREKGTKIILLMDAKYSFTKFFYKIAKEKKVRFDIF
jgi:4-amino-4-deoxy-L-arabinose transferase-like glycosyltransferase